MLNVHGFEMGFFTVVFAQQWGQAVCYPVFFSSIKLFADMKTGAHFTHQVLLTVNPR